MLVFPQLQNGSLAQNVRRSRRRRVIEAEHPDGTRSLFLDSRVDAMHWTLRLDNLSIDEWQSIESLFISAQGRLKSFLFIDPLGNILSQTDDLEDRAWSRGAYLTVSAGQSDPWGGQTGTLVVNTGQNEGTLDQAVAVPGSLQYTLSVYLRAQGATNVDLLIESSGIDRRASVAVSADWRRFSLTAALGVISAGCRFGIVIPAGRSVECCGFQAEAQPFPSQFKKTMRGAVYPTTRFESDALPVDVSSPGCFSTTLHLTSRTS